MEERKGLIKKPVSPPHEKDKKNKETGKTGFWNYVNRHRMLATIVVALILLVILFLWMDIKARRDTNRIIESATLEIEQLNQEKLLLLSRPMIWAIRAEMLRDNNEQIGLLLADMVKERSFQNIFLANAQGEIIVSTNKIQEGQLASQYFGDELLSSETSVVHRAQNDNLILAAPVMGFDRRLGTLVIEYQPENVSFAVQ